ncbi:hypothetical protein LCGC14_2941090 [marine sediment metagenome]|uniref:Uncharacterized protein n=1 Tax=marine sediment metagenome TaxID=412755 RepID=A0A0F8XHX2_9ZZZZ
MKSYQEIKDRLEEVNNAIDDLTGRNNPIELNKLMLKAETLKWVIEG